MGRTKLQRTRIYRETVDKCLADHDMRKTDFCDAMGHTSAWYGTTFGTKGYYNITKAQLKLWAITIGCTEDELTKIPVAVPKKEEKPTVTEVGVTNDELMAVVNNLTATLIDGFRMLHQDIQILTETMHKYWKPEEPKYEIKEREQP